MELATETTPVSTDANDDTASGGWFRRVLPRLGRAAEGTFGFASMVLAMAIVSAIPVLNLLSLGYLLECSARVARSGKIRHGFVGMKAFARAGSIVLGVWLWTLPIRLVHSFWRDAELIDPGGPRADGLRIFLALLVVAISLHLIWAVVRGGKFRHFLWPAPLRFVRWLGEEGKASTFRKRLSSLMGLLDLRTYALLGAGGFAGAAIWLALPLLLLVVAGSVEKPGPSALLSLVGGIGLGFAVLFVPFLQTRYAVTRRFRDFLSLAGVRQLFRRAPLAFWLALFVTLLFALPLYLLKIELTPREVAWLPNLVFVAFIFPARILVGWAVSRALRRETNRIWVSRWIARLASLPVVAAYVFIVWLTQYLSWHGSFSLLEQHAFLVPAPLLGL